MRTDFVEAWRSGSVKRYHVMETVETNLVSQHSWGVVLLLLMLWPSVPRNVVVAAQLHDFGEKATGDMPGPVKWSNPVMESEMDRMERQHMMERLPAFLVSAVSSLSEMEWAVIELCDRAEFCMSMIHERMLGNKYAEIYYKRAWDKMTLTLENNRGSFMTTSDDLFSNIIAMRRNLDDNWRKARS